MKATLKDVAQEAGVSKALVSKYLAQSPDARMRDDTRKRIDEAIKKCHYFPSKLAKSLKSGKTQTIGLVVSELRNAFWSAFADYALREARQHGYRLLISLCGDDGAETPENLQALMEYRIDGIIYCENLHPCELTEQLHNSKFPMVLMYQESELFHTARIDYAKALADAVEYFAGCGQCGIFCIYSGNSSWAQILERECRARNMAFEKKLTVMEPEALTAALHEVCCKKPPVIFLNGWRTAVLLLQIIEKEFPQYHPEIVLNFHFDHPAFFNPHIAGFIRSDFEETARSSVRMLIRMIEGEQGEDIFPAAEFVSAEAYRRKCTDNEPHYFLY